MIMGSHPLRGSAYMWTLSKSLKSTYIFIFWPQWSAMSPEVRFRAHFWLFWELSRRLRCLEKAGKNQSLQQPMCSRAIHV